MVCLSYLDDTRAVCRHVDKDVTFRLEMKVGGGSVNEVCALVVSLFNA